MATIAKLMAHKEINGSVRALTRVLNEHGEKLSEGTVRQAFEGRAGRSEASRLRLMDRLERAASGIDLRRKLRVPTEAEVSSSAPGGALGEQEIEWGPTKQHSLSAGKLDKGAELTGRGVIEKEYNSQPSRPQLDKLIGEAASKFGAFTGGGTGDVLLSAYGVYWTAEGNYRHAGGESASRRRDWYTIRTTVANLRIAFEETERQIAREKEGPGIRGASAEDRPRLLRQLWAGDPADWSIHPSFAARLLNNLYPPGIEWERPTYVSIRTAKGY